MASDSGSDTETNRIDIKFKTTTDTFSLNFKENAPILNVRKRVAERLQQPLDKICLIFAGKLLRDQETLNENKITNDLVIHVVVRQQTKANLERQQIPISSSQTSAQQPMSQTLIGAQQLLNNEDFMQQFSPMIQGFLDNPEIIQSILTQSPQMQQLIQNNPDLGHILNDPQIMRETLEIIRNPSQLNELVRSHDQAVRNLQGIPGGEAALQRLYRDVQEPLLNSTLGSLINNPYLTPNNPNTQVTSRSQRAGVENAEALPNPWGSIVNNQRPANTTGSQQPNFDLMNTPGIQSLFRQMSSNPAMMQSLMSPENLNQVNNLFAQNPGIIQQIMPTLLGPNSNTSEVSEQFRETLPNIMNMMANPENVRAFSNPRVLNAMAQIQSAAQVIREEAPQIFQNLPGVGSLANLNNLFGPRSTDQSSTPTSVTTQDNVAHEQGGNDNSNGGQQGLPSGLTLANLMGQMMQLGAPMQSNLPPEQRFQAQLEQLAGMGFTNQQRNIEALLATFGDVSQAIERLLSNNQ